MSSSRWLLLAWFLSGCTDFDALVSGVCQREVGRPTWCDGGQGASDGGSDAGADAGRFTAFDSGVPQWDAGPGQLVFASRWFSSQPGQAVVHGVAVQADGGFVVVGGAGSDLWSSGGSPIFEASSSTNAFGVFGLSPEKAGGMQGWDFVRSGKAVRAISAQGNELWLAVELPSGAEIMLLGAGSPVTKASMSGAVIPTSIQGLPDGGFATAGYFSGAASFPASFGPTQLLDGGTEMFVTDGASTVASSCDGGRMMATDMVVTPQGEVVTTGIQQGSCTLGTSSSSPQQASFVGVQGTAQYHAASYSPGDDVDLALTPDGANFWQLVRVQGQGLKLRLFHAPPQRSQQFDLTVVTQDGVYPRDLAVDEHGYLYLVGRVAAGAGARITNFAGRALGGGTDPTQGLFAAKLYWDGGTELSQVWSRVLGTTSEEAVAVAVKDQLLLVAAQCKADFAADGFNLANPVSDTENICLFWLRP